MFFEDTSFDSDLNHEKELEKGKVFDVVNRVINDDQVSKPQRPNFESSFDRLAKLANSSNRMNASSPLFQTTSSHFSADARTDSHRNERPVRERSPLRDRASSFAQNSPFIDNSELVQNYLNYANSLSSFHKLNSPSSISSPNPANFSNFFTFHQLHQQPHHLSNHHFPDFHPTNFNGLPNNFDQSHFNENRFPLSNPKHRSDALTSRSEQTSQSNKASLPARIWHERPKPSIHTLQPELWTIIFENLNIRDKGRVARTCTFFRDVVYSKSVWKGEVARLHLAKRNSVLLESLTRRGIKSVQVSLLSFFFFIFLFLCDIFGQASVLRSQLQSTLDKIYSSFYEPKWFGYLPTYVCACYATRAIFYWHRSKSIC